MKNMQDFLVYGSPQINDEEINEVIDCLKSGWIGTGPKVKRFEDQFIKYKNSKYAIAVNSCTAAIHLSLLSLDVGPGDEVITTPLTFFATAGAVVRVGATPVFVDIDENDFVKSVNTLEKVEGDIFVGGDHSITYPLFKGFASGRENVGLIVFDAHPDCVNNFSPPTHEDYLRVLVEEGVVGCSQVLLVGLRKIDEIEKKFLGSRGIEYVCYSKNRKLNSLTQKNKGGGAHCFSDGDEDISSKIEEFLSKVDDVYLSVDIDVLNSKFAPGTGYVEEGGFGLDELVGFLKIVCGSCKVGRVDLVEVNPDKDVDGKTVESAKKILEIFVDGN